MINILTRLKDITLLKSFLYIIESQLNTVHVTPHLKLQVVNEF